MKWGQHSDRRYPVRSGQAAIRRSSPDAWRAERHVRCRSKGHGPGNDVLYQHPDDMSDYGWTWREALLKYNQDRPTNPLGLLPAWQLYDNPAYGRLAERVGIEKMFILSAGWGLIRGDFLTPYYCPMVPHSRWCAWPPRTGSRGRSAPWLARRGLTAGEPQIASRTTWRSFSVLIQAAARAEGSSRGQWPR